MNILILRREDGKVSKLIYTEDENKVRGTKTKLWGGWIEGGGCSGAGGTSEQE